MRIVVVVGARPNFVKAAPVVSALRDHKGVDVVLLHTGQHYDRQLSDSFIEHLGLPEPDHHLGVGSGSHAEQTAAVLVGVERVLTDRRPDAIVVVGDVNSTLGAALAAAKLGVLVVHLESGLRSRDWTMPEEINRVVVDRISDLLLCHCQEAVDNLIAEGATPRRIALVGNTMIDSLFRLLPAAEQTGVLTRLGLESGRYALVTLHRPALVDDRVRLTAVVHVLAEMSANMPVVFPVHPRTRSRLDGIGRTVEGLLLVDPLPYLDFIALEARARLVVTDSGGVQEETSVLGVPCLTYRDNTERGVTIGAGTNRLVGIDPTALRGAIAEELGGGSGVGESSIPLWDGLAGQRAAAEIMSLVAASR